MLQVAQRSELFNIVVTSPFCSVQQNTLFHYLTFPIIIFLSFPHLFTLFYFDMAYEILISQTGIKPRP